MEKFMTFNIGDVKFIDSFQFMASSLESLAKNLITKSTDKYEKFDNMNKYFNADELELVCKKGFYPYEFMDNIDKFEYPSLPSKDKFYSSLRLSDISDDDYEHALNVYNKFNCSKFLDYHMLYLKCDVLLLADVFENFRNTSISYYKLDPANYISIASYAWDAMLLKTGISIDLISDKNLLEKVEKSKRGGYTFVGTERYVKANNKYLDDYDENIESNYLLYVDANNLYGQAMCQHLPYGNIKIDNDILLDDVIDTPDDSDIGYMVEVDIAFPKEMHELLKQFVPCPENITPRKEWYSDYQDELQKLTKANTNTTKLVAHLYERKNYTLHYRNLKFLIKLIKDFKNLKTKDIIT
jgi:hypothetical protein